LCHCSREAQGGSIRGGHKNQWNQGLSQTSEGDLKGGEKVFKNKDLRVTLKDGAEESGARTVLGRRKAALNPGTTSRS
jgi:hypothetical protein